MTQNHDFPLPPNLPVPVDDGAARHLTGMEMPRLALRSTAGRMVDLGCLSSPRTVIYCYPMTGVPGKPLLPGWDMIPGARGCTPQTCGFRDHYQDLLDRGVAVFGCSTQTTDYQREMVDRLHVPFEILSDAEFKLRDALNLPTFDAAGVALLKRLTLVIRGNHIEHVFYPVFPPDESANDVLHWLDRHPLASEPS
jgi:peroxiredoxin